MAANGSASFVDQLVDDLMPGDLDWRAKVGAYPIPALLLAAAGGFLLGRSQGRHLLSTVSELAVREMTNQLGAVLERNSSDPA